MFMPTINVIDYKRESYIKAFAYTFFIFNKRFTTRNINIFEDFNII